MSFTPRLFLATAPSPDQKEITLDESASRYLVKVLRLELGAKFLGFDAQAVEYELQLNQTDVVPATATVISRNKKKEMGQGNWIALGQSLPKGPKIDLILKQGTEAGVNRFIPLVTQRSVSRPDESRFEHKNNRWQKILVEACRQCGRNDVPQLDEVTDWKKCLELFSEFDQVLLPYEKEAPTLKTVLESNSTARKILVLVGPEGGWSKDEVQEAQQRGAAAVHLPTPILRTETAGLAIVSMIQYALSHP
ncbi:MAG TPA: 16S rRNA (uracil(1498)-N(3))-methyltransferase [bacterium]|jgi:16S rRNA (uracil1498-N3)-methyltransferase|nr:16S rRNA (uracil(1498)-N(3))-methyltransferase [bacterium]